MNGINYGLESCGFFKGLSPNYVAYLLEKIVYEVNDYSPGEIIFSYEKAADTIGLILEGTVHVQKILPSGNIVTVTTRSFPELLADASVFSSAKTYPSIVSAQSKTKLMLIKKEEVLKLFSLDQNIMRNFLQCVSNRVIVLNKKIELLSLNSIREKIAFFLLDSMENNNSTCVRVPFSKKVWAEHMNVSRTSLSRELKTLSESCIIEFHKRTIQILNSEELESILQSY